MQPKFWKRKSLLSVLLRPLSVFYSLAGLLRGLIIHKYQPGVPVICIGNVTVGGAGKTPVVLAISEILRKQGLNVAIASRGYKGEFTKPTLVDKTRHTVNSVGDEPLMLSRIAPTYIAKNRPLAIQMAEQSGSNIIIMDDGMQNPSVKKDLILLVIDGKYGIGNGFIMPAGPLRESLANGAFKSDAVILIGNDDNNVLDHNLFKMKYSPKIIRAKLEPFGNLPDKSKKYLAFAGIGNPDKFFSTLAEYGYNVVGKIAFPDHYNYSDKDINEVIKKAEEIGAELITTEKDEVRLPIFSKNRIRVLPVRIVWEDEEQIHNVLDRALKK